MRWTISYFPFRSCSTPTSSTPSSRKMPMPRRMRRRDREQLGPPRVTSLRQRCHRVQISATGRGTTRTKIFQERAVIQKMRRILVRGGIDNRTNISSPNRLFMAGSLPHLSRASFKRRRRRPQPRRRPSIEWISITANGPESVAPVPCQGELATIRALFCSSNSPKIT